MKNFVAFILGVLLTVAAFASGSPQLGIAIASAGWFNGKQPTPPSKPPPTAEFY